METATATAMITRTGMETEMKTKEMVSTMYCVCRYNKLSKICG